MDVGGTGSPLIRGLGLGDGMGWAIYRGFVLGFWEGEETRG